MQQNIFTFSARLLQAIVTLVVYTALSHAQPFELIVAIIWESNYYIMNSERIGKMFKHKKNIQITLITILMTFLLIPALAFARRSTGRSHTRGHLGLFRGPTSSDTRGHIGLFRGPGNFSRVNSNRSSSGIRHSGQRTSTGIHRRSGLHHSSGLSRYGSLHHNSGFRRHGSSNYGHRKQRSYRYSVPSYRYYSYPYTYYYGYPNTYYYSLPHRRYYYYGYPYSYDNRRYYNYGTDRPDQYKDTAEDTEQADLRRQLDKSNEAAQRALREARQANKTVEHLKADRYIDSVAKLFAKGDYRQAVGRASEALKAQPDSPILPFVYAQSLFANQQYGDAAGVLRETLRKVDVKEMGVFYSTGFYQSQATLNDQIGNLSEAAQNNPDLSGLQLLLGYQLLGLERFDDARNALELAKTQYTDKDAAETLIWVLNETKKTQQTTEKTQQHKPASDY